ncbi:hypothetical protein BS78_05G196900, partial [Paspalum vaginatum]
WRSDLPAVSLLATPSVDLGIGSTGGGESGSTDVRRRVWRRREGAGKVGWRRCNHAGVGSGGGAKARGRWAGGVRERGSEGSEERGAGGWETDRGPSMGDGRGGRAGRTTPVWCVGDGFGGGGGRSLGRRVRVLPRLHAVGGPLPLPLGRRWRARWRRAPGSLAGRADAAPSIPAPAASGSARSEGGGGEERRRWEREQAARGEGRGARAVGARSEGGGSRSGWPDHADGGVGRGGGRRTTRKAGNRWCWNHRNFYRGRDKRVVDS